MQAHAAERSPIGNGNSRRPFEPEPFLHAEGANVRPKSNWQFIKRISMQGISVVVPVYRSAATLQPLVERLTPVLQRVAERHEIILVEDGGLDTSWNVIETLAQDNPRIKGIRLSRNYGQHNALLCGIRAANYPVIVTLDDDLQHPPEEIPRLLAELEAGFDVVYGAPEREQHSFLRDKASIITKIALQNAMGAQTARHVSAFRVFRTGLRDAFAAYQSPFVSIDVLLTWGTTRFTHLQVRHDPRSVGVSNYTLRKLFTHAMNMVTGFSTVPLQIASFVGFGFTAFGIALFCYVLARYFMDRTTVPGFPFLASIIAIFSGAQLFALGMIGEYLARMHFRSMGRPAYAVASTLNRAEEPVAPNRAEGAAQ
ncbi:glycosyltransferase family 2 protein [Paraburkholderia sp. D15]|uniref:glycosyltransferase family 2 protein n=1 Tax=Paraburkholderia sp. D15 TaxID=2880218 RepID=UPI00247A4F0D|nr:glycosyltransferase family 2 protein [Paraburkholderia sp. D15]WGS54152.1 glycosyltransferase family 2 protein [Paraburkholderia sp. D15]